MQDLYHQQYHQDQSNAGDPPGGWKIQGDAETWTAPAVMTTPVQEMGLHQKHQRRGDRDLGWVGGVCSRVALESRACSCGVRQ